MTPQSRRPKSELRNVRVVVVRQKTPMGLILALIGVAGVLAVLAVLMFARYAGGPSAEAPVAATSPPVTAPVAKVPADWKKIGDLKGELQVLAIDPSDPRLQYLGMNGQGVMASRDGGATWASLGLPTEVVLDISVDPKDSKHLIAATLQGLQTSKDGGKSWKKASGLPAGQFHVAQFDPNDPRFVWSGLWKSPDTLYLSSDGGKSWSKVEGGPQGADINFVSYDKDSGTAYASGFGKGLFSTKDHGNTWQTLNAGLPSNTDITLIVFSADKKTMFAGTHDFGVYRSVDNGRNWTAVNSGKESANDVHGLVADPKDPGKLYAAGMMMGKGVFVSGDRGDSWQPLETGDINLDDVHVFSLTPDGKDIIMGSGDHGGEPLGTLYRTSVGSDKGGAL